MKSRFLIGSIIMLSISLTSCVSSKKFKASEEQAQKSQTELKACDDNLKSSNAKIASLNDQVASLQNQNATLSSDAAKYHAIMENEKARQAELDAALAEQGTSMKELQDKLVTGLVALLDSGMEIGYKEGLLHILLPEKMVFQVGNANLTAASKNALSPLASILNDYPKVQVYVVGHTDATKIHNAKFEDNWSLSTERANSIVRVLIGKYSMDPARLLAAGRSKYMPIATNDTKEGQALNRRIDIILNPNLIKLYELMNR